MAMLVYKSAVKAYRGTVRGLAWNIEVQAGRIGYSAAIRQAKNKGYSFELVLAAVRASGMRAGQ